VLLPKFLGRLGGGENPVRVIDVFVDSSEGQRPGVRATCRQFFELCRKLDGVRPCVAAIGGSKFKAVNAPDSAFSR
jgi:hypothetical protein